MKKTLPTFVAALLAGATAASAASIPASNALEFDVFRKGSDIGDYMIRFAPEGDKLNVRVNTDVAVKILGFTAYEFEQDSTESWKDGKLASLNTVTNDNGDAHEVSIGASGLLPASLWNVDIVRENSALNTIDGHTMSINVTRVGDENVTTGHGDVGATHYRISGDLARDLWYAKDGTLAKVVFAGDDGSQVEYRLR